MAHPGIAKIQNEIKSHYSKRGFANQGSTPMGIEMSKIDSDGFVQKVVIDIHGRVQKYKPYKPILFEKQALPHDPKIEQALYQFDNI